MIFSAVSVFGSRRGSVGCPVSRCVGCFWVWRRGFAPTLALVVSPAASSCVRVFASVCASRFGVTVSVRRHRGAVFLRVRGSRSSLLAVARWWSS